MVSQCLGFEACRYNGERASSRLRDLIGPYVDWVPICPEVQIGLGIPREPIRLVTEDRDSSQLKLLQPSTQRDLSRSMAHFSKSFLETVGPVDGFLLKSASPSCGVRDAKYYAAAEDSPALGRGPGLFAAAVLERFPHLAVEDEGRLTNLRIREHFLTRIFTAARYRRLEEAPSLAKLIEFHSRHKLLLLAYNQTRLRDLGRLVGSLRKSELEAGLARYRELLGQALQRLPRLSAHCNVLQHAFGYFSKELSRAEKAHFLNLIERYTSAKISLSALIEVMKIWLVRFQIEYLLEQVYFEPFPEPLLSLQDSGKGRT